MIQNSIHLYPWETDPTCQQLQQGAPLHPGKLIASLPLMWSTVLKINSKGKKKKKWQKIPNLEKQKLLTPFGHTKCSSGETRWIQTHDIMTHHYLLHITIYFSICTTNQYTIAELTPISIIIVRSSLFISNKWMHQKSRIHPWSPKQMTQKKKKKIKSFVT